MPRRKPGPKDLSLIHISVLPDNNAMYSEKSGMNFSEYMALLSGNPDLLDKAKLEKRIASLEGERKSFNTVSYTHLDVYKRQAHRGGQDFA